jgi:hypothetical protein
MTWLAQNWIWVLFGIAFVAMHLFGHGGHGGHGGHSGNSGHGSDQSTRRNSSAVPAVRPEGSSPVIPVDTSGPRHH